MPQDDSKLWVTYDTVCQEAGCINEESPEEKTKNIIKNVVSRIDMFINIHDGTELIIGPGFDDTVKAAMKSRSLSHGLQYTERVHERQEYYCISQRINIRNVGLQLKRKGSRDVYCRYTLVTDTKRKPVHITPPAPSV
mgnify:FL=1